MPNRLSPGCNCCGAQQCTILSDDFEREDIESTGMWDVASGDWYILDGELTVSVPGTMTCLADDSGLPADRYIKISFKGSGDDVFVIAGVEVKIGSGGYIGRQGYTPSAYTCDMPIAADTWHTIEIFMCGESLYSGKVLLDGVDISITALGTLGEPHLVATTISDTLYFDDLVWEARNKIGETQTMSFSPFFITVTGGTFDLTYKGNTETFSATMVGLLTAIKDWLEGIDGEGITVSASFFGSEPYTIVWGFNSTLGLYDGPLNGIDQPLIVGDGSNLLGNVVEGEEQGYDIIIEETIKGRTCPYCCQCVFTPSCEWTSVTIDITDWTDDTYLGSALNGTYTLDLAEDEACVDFVSCGYGCPCFTGEIGVELLLADPPDEGDYIEYRYTEALFCSGGLYFRAGEYRLNGGTWTEWTPEVSGDYSVTWVINSADCNVTGPYDLASYYTPPSMGSGEAYFEGS